MAKGTIESKDYVKFHISRSHKLLYKNFLEILEDIRDSRQPLSDYDYQRLRKRVLDRGNDSEREALTVIEDFLE